MGIMVVFAQIWHFKGDQRVTEFFQSGFGFPNLPIPTNTDHWISDLLGDARSLKQIMHERFYQMTTFENDVASTLILTDEKNLNSMIATYNSMYQLREPSEIRVFLEDNDFLNPIITEAYGKLQKHFPSSTIFMEVEQNELVISVGTTLSPQEAKEKLDKFDEEWWLDNCMQSHAKLCITVEFQ
jgi:hypothetical protein